MSPTQLEPIGRRAFAVGVVLTIVTIASVFIDAPQFFQSYLFAWFFWAGLTLGERFTGMFVIGAANRRRTGQPASSCSKPSADGVGGVDRSH